MTMQDYIDNLKLELTGGVLELEINDDTLQLVVKRALQEVQRYIDSTEFITVPYAPCIDLNDSDVSSVARVYRSTGYMGTQPDGRSSTIDPMYGSMWMAFSGGGSMYNLNDYLLNYMTYNTLLQMRNTTSTDMSFKQDMQTGKLYINTGMNKPQSVTIEYVPKFREVEQIKSDYWKDILQRLSLAHTKIILGRVRGRYKQSNALWTQDSDEMLSEGTKELEELREVLRVNSQMIFLED